MTHGAWSFHVCASRLHRVALHLPMVVRWLTLCVFVWKPSVHMQGTPNQQQCRHRIKNVKNKIMFHFWAAASRLPNKTRVWICAYSDASIGRFIVCDTWKWFVTCRNSKTVSYIDIDWIYWEHTAQIEKADVVPILFNCNKVVILWIEKQFIGSPGSAISCKEANDACDILFYFCETYGTTSFGMIILEYCRCRKKKLRKKMFKSTFGLDNYQI